MENLPTTCSFNGVDGNDFLTMLIVFVVFLAAQLLINRFKGKHAMNNNTKNIGIIILLIVAIAVAVTVKQSKHAQKTDVAPAKAAAVLQLPRLVDLGADKCIPCKMMAPILDDLKTNYIGRLDVEFIDVWKNSDAGKQYGVRVIPTQIFFSKDGKELFRHEGFFSKEDILAKWKELGIELAAGTP